MCFSSWFFRTFSRLIHFIYLGINSCVGCSSVGRLIKLVLACVVAVGPVIGSWAWAARISGTWVRTWLPPRAWPTWSPRPRDSSRYENQQPAPQTDAVQQINHKMFPVASRVLARSTCCRPHRGLWGGRKPCFPQSQWRWGGAGGEKDQAAAEHPAAPEGAQGKEQRLGEPPSSRACGAGL